jgi:hypothetical protein
LLSDGTSLFSYTFGGVETLLINGKKKRSICFFFCFFFFVCSKKRNFEWTSFSRHALQ